MKSGRFAIYLLLAVTIGLAARWTASSQVKQRVAAETSARPSFANDLASDPRFLFPDSMEFESYAHTLAFPEVAPDAEGTLPPRDDRGRQAWRTPLYSWLLAGWYGIAGDDIARARSLNLALDLLTIVLVGLAGRALAKCLDWRRPEMAGGMAAALYALDPWNAFFSALILSESLASLLVTLATWLAFEWVHARQWTRSTPRRVALWGLATGVVCGLATLAKPSLVLYVALLAAFAVMTRWRRPPLAGETPFPTLETPGWSGRVGGSTLWLALGFVLAMSPWWLNTSRRFAPDFVPFSTMGTFVLWETLGPDATGGANFGSTPFPVSYLMLREALAGDVWRDHPKHAEAETAYYPATKKRFFPAADKRFFLGAGKHGVVGDGDATAAGAGPLFVEVALMLPTEKSWPLDPEGWLRDLAPLEGLGGWVRAEWNRERWSRAEAAAWIELKAARELLERLGPTLRVEGETDPGVKLLRQAPRKLALLWSPTPNWVRAADWGGWVRGISLAAFVVTLAGVAIGLGTARGAWRMVGWFLLPALYLTAVHVVMLASVRYRLPAWGALCVLSGLGWSLALGRAGGSEAERRPLQ